MSDNDKIRQLAELVAGGVAPKPAEPANLSAAFQVGFQVKNHAGYPTAPQPPL